MSNPRKNRLLKKKRRQRFQKWMDQRLSRAIERLRRDLQNSLRYTIKIEGDIATLTHFPVTPLEYIMLDFTIPPENPQLGYWQQELEEVLF